MPLNPITVVQQVLEEYRSHLATEFQASDKALRDALERALDEPGFLAQEPFFQTHRPFKDGKPWSELNLDASLARVMEKRSQSKKAWLHQSDAIEHLLGHSAGPLLVTTGTGSGKTECFLLPVIQNAIHDSSTFSKNGLTALLIYPMNALANDQEERIRSYLQDTGFTGVSVARYDRSTKEEDRRRLRENPPHILLTNYMMLEYLLVRPADRDALFANHRCRFVVLDEVHSYRGSLGANIALLYRRLGAHLRNARQDWNTSYQPTSRRFPTLIPVATSATIKSINEAETTPDARRRMRDEAVQSFLSDLTGVAASQFKVLGEELKDLTMPPGLALKARMTFLLNDLLAHKPMSVTQMVCELPARDSECAQLSQVELRSLVEQVLDDGAAKADGDAEALRLRVHRFVRGGWHFTRCVDPACGRLHAMGEETCGCGAVAAPLYLCRSCGADTLRFKAASEEGKLTEGGRLVPFAGRGALDEEWILYDRSRTNAEADDEGLVGLEKQMRERPVLQGSFDPATCMFNPDETLYPMKVALAPARSRCLACGGTAGARDVLTEVSLGTSAAVRVLSEGLVQGLSEQNRSKPGHDGKERLLIFADSRQDAAHQARFITYASRYDRMRRRLLAVLGEAPASGATLENTVERLRAKGVGLGDNPRVGTGRTDKYLSQDMKCEATAWEEAPLLDDLAVSSGYRATVFNLGLVGVTYQHLDDYSADEGAELAQRLRITTPQLAWLCRCLLDEMRKRGCLSREMLRYHPGNPNCPYYYNVAADWERKVKTPAGYCCDEKGRPVGAMDASEVPAGIKHLNAWRRGKGGGRGPSLERVLRHLLDRMGGLEPDEEVMLSILDFLSRGPELLVPTELFGYRQSRWLLQVNAQSVLLKVLAPDQRFRCTVCNVRMPFAVAGAPCPKCRGTMQPWAAAEVEQNRYVQRIRRNDVPELNAGEHTAQVTGESRIELEEAFKAPAPGFVPPHGWSGPELRSPVNVLACSPTLEMGIDVGGLDAVVMRNVPPRPDNYAQRGGRAGRRSRVGVVLGYARSTPHDWYFYDKPTEMIAGEVAAPAVGLGNRDVTMRHLHALVFGAAQPGLSGRMGDYITNLGELNQDKVDALIAALMDQVPHAADLALQAWEPRILQAAGLADKAAIQKELNQLPGKVMDLFARVCRQIRELQETFARWNELPSSEKQATNAQRLKLKLLGIPSGSGKDRDADDRSSGNPMRRFAEFGILPGYEFPSEPCTLRLWRDSNEDDPVTVARRFGLAQYQPEALVHARGHRWRVRGLDLASPWNPGAESPDWPYVVCRDCGLRYEAGAPCCRRCGSDDAVGSGGFPGFEYGGFLAMRDDTPVLEEEDRFGNAAAVSCHPQRDGQVKARYLLPTGWSMSLNSEEMVRWVNEGPTPSDADRKQNRPRLHDEGRGFYLCPKCGYILKMPEDSDENTKGRKKARTASAHDPYGHATGCAAAGQKPSAIALTTKAKATTLRIEVVLPAGTGEEEHASWGLSLGHALRIGMRQLYMLDGSEIEVELERQWTRRKQGEHLYLGALTFIDAAVGGSGFLERAAQEFHLVARRALEHLDHPKCESACYRCLKSYTNQRHHHVLNWPRVLGDLESLAIDPPAQVPLGKLDSDDPRPWLEAYEAGVGSPLELKFLRLFEKHGIQVETQVMVAPDEGAPHISQADFRVSGTKTLVYVDGAAFHRGRRLRRDRLIRERLQNGSAGWRIVTLTARDLADPESVISRVGQGA